MTEPTVIPNPEPDRQPDEPKDSQPAFSDFGGPRAAPQQLSKLSVASLALGASAAGGFCLLVATVALVFGFSGGVAELPMPVLLLPPMLGLLAATSAVAALVVITRSNGAVGGSGFAIGGLLLGLIATMIAGGIAIGATQMGQRLSGAVTDILEAIERDQVDPIKRYTTARTAERLELEDLQQFRATWEAELGTFERGPTPAEFNSWGDDVAGAMALYEQLDIGAEFIPVPASFAGGKAVVVLQVRQIDVRGSVAGEVVNVGIFTNAGRQFWMIDPSELAFDEDERPEGIMPFGAEPGQDQDQDPDQGSGP